jgi:hypothetical protein
MSLSQNHILVISYSDKTREILRENLKMSGIAAICCSSFCEAENQAVLNLCSGILVDLTSMIKARGEEKIVACSLTGFYPTLRVRSDGLMLIPTTMPDGTKQDNSLSDFLQYTCAAFPPRMLRAYKRHKITVSALLIHKEVEIRTFTLDISWGGAFLVDTLPDKFTLMEKVEIRFPEFGCSVDAEIRWIQLWGDRYAAGTGVKFEFVGSSLEAALCSILKTTREKDRARLVA